MITAKSAHGVARTSLRRVDHGPSLLARALDWVAKRKEKYSCFFPFFLNDHPLIGSLFLSGSEIFFQGRMSIFQDRMSILFKIGCLCSGSDVFFQDRKPFSGTNVFFQDRNSFFRIGCLFFNSRRPCSRNRRSKSARDLIQTMQLFAVCNCFRSANDGRRGACFRNVLFEIREPKMAAGHFSRDRGVLMFMYRCIKHTCMYMFMYTHPHTMCIHTRRCVCVHVFVRVCVRELIDSSRFVMVCLGSLISQNRIVN